MQDKIFNYFEQSLRLLAKQAIIFGLDEPEESLFHEYIKICESLSLQPANEILSALNIAARIESTHKVVELSLSVLFEVEEGGKPVSAPEDICKQYIKNDWSVSIASVKYRSESKSRILDALLGKKQATLVEAILTKKIDVEREENYVECALLHSSHYSPLENCKIVSMELYAKCEDELSGMISI